jgi:2-oxo-3-hexenedioate decarboxylase
MKIDHRHWAEYLLDAVDRRAEVKSIASHIGDFSVDDAYLIQEELLQLKLGRGETIVGAKLGLTSIAKQQQMGVSEPAYGWITSGSVLDSDDVPLNQLIHPRIEPEFVFTMAQDISGPAVTANDVLDATASVKGGIEVIDSRYEAFKFTLPDVIADNTSAAMTRINPTGLGSRDTDLTVVGCTFEVGGEVMGTATGAALLGDPAACMAMLVHHLHKTGRKLEAGWTVLAGAPTDARPLGLGTVGRARYSAFETVRVEGVAS